MTKILQTAQLEWKNETTPVSGGFNDIYFSAENGLEESRYIFLKHNKLAEKFSVLHPNDTFYIFETGFGSGLNFLNTWQLWKQLHAQPSQQDIRPLPVRATQAAAKLHFISVERFPLTAADLSTCLGKWPELHTMAKSLVKNYPALVPGLHRLEFSDNVVLDLYFGDLADALDAIRHHPSENGQQQLPLKINSWFLDGFAPAKNPDMWSEKLFQQMRVLSAQNSSFATFTAAGAVKRQLLQQGFTVQKVKGFGRKREMLIGELSLKKINNAERKHQTPWYCYTGSNINELANTETAKNKIAVIGAGLAGAHTAWQLRQLGLNVDVFEKNTQPAQLGSGNSQGILYAKISGHNSTQNNFVWKSHLMAERFYRSLFQQGVFQEKHGELCGVLQLAYSSSEEKRLHQLQQLPPDPRFWQLLDAAQASAIAGVQLQHPALFMPRAGWLNPGLIVQTLLESTSDNSKNRLINNTEVCSIQRQAEKQQWQLFDAQQKPLGYYDNVVVCNAQAAQQFSQCQHLPLQFIRGQTNLLEETAITRNLKAAICHKGYLPPAYHGEHCFGSSFIMDDTNTELRDQETLLNLQHLCDYLPEQKAINKVLNGRAAIRVNTPDYLPLIGPLADEQAFSMQYQELSKDATLTISDEAPNLPGFFVNIAHGSRGLATSVLAARYLGQLLTGQHPEIDSKLIRALSPNRFFYRNLKRKNTH